VGSKLVFLFCIGLPLMQAGCIPLDSKIFGSRNRGISKEGRHTAPGAVANSSRANVFDTYPKEVKAVLSGKQFIERVTAANKELENPWFDLVPVSPLLNNPERLAKPLNKENETLARTYGYRMVIPKEEGKKYKLPPYVIFHQPLKDSELRRPDGSLKPLIYVGNKSNSPQCVPDKYADLKEKYLGKDKEFKEPLLSGSFHRLNTI
jgi:hypothetical protein